MHRYKPQQIMITAKKWLLQAVMKASEEQAAMFNEETVAARREATATAMLPKSFDSVRAIFGPCGPSVMPMQKVRSQNHVLIILLKV